MGDTVNVASRLADLATAGRVLVDRNTYDLTSYAISYGPRRGKRAKGLARPLPTYEALAVRPHLPRPRRAGEGEGTFVDREVETARLETELRTVRRRRRCRVHVIAGEPGLGKTRLAEEFARRSRPARVLTGRCRPFGQRRPLDALGEALSAEILGTGPHDVDASKAVLERTAGRIGDPTERAGVARDLGILLGLERPRGRRPDAIESVVRAARGIVEDLAKDGPVLLILDDLHWADPELLDVIRDAHTAPWKGPILVLGLSRPEGVDPVFPRLDLSALDEGGSRALAEDVLGSDLAADLIQGLVARSGGNPLFLEESVGMLVDSGAIVEEGGRWHVRRPHEFERVPSAIRRLIAARLDGLPSDEKHLLQDAAVVGDTVWDGLLEHLFEGASCRPTLRSLEARDLLRRPRPSLIPGEAEYGFKHVLIREVAYDSLPKAERARKHLAIAGWLDEQVGHDDPAVIAHHYESAWHLLHTRTGPPPPPEVGSLAVRSLRRYGDESFAYQARRAEAAYARALNVAETEGQASRMLSTRRC